MEVILARPGRAMQAFCPRLYLGHISRDAFIVYIFIHVLCSFLIHCLFMRIFFNWYILVDFFLKMCVYVRAHTPPGMGVIGSCVSLLPWVLGTKLQSYPIKKSHALSTVEPAPQNLIL